MEKRIEDNGYKKGGIDYKFHFKCVGAKGFEPLTPWV